MLHLDATPAPKRLAQVLFSEAAVKVRLRDNSIRLRLTRTEVSTLAAGRPVENATPFGPAAGQTLTFRIKPDNADALTISQQGLCIEFSVPIRMISGWAEAETVGFEEHLTLTPERLLHLFVEKDFACLVPRKGGDDIDTFVNPAACSASA